MISLIKYKVVVDSNVFISGSLFGGNPQKIIRLIEHDAVSLVISPEIEFEVFQKLADLDTPQENVKRLKELFKYTATPIVPTKKVSLCRDPKDNKLLEAALASKADYLITGDKDLLMLSAYQHTGTLTPKQFLKILKDL